MGELAELSEQERRLLDFVREHRRRHGQTPTYEEIAAALGWASKRSVGYHVESLKEKGYVRNGLQRQIELVEEPASVPLIGVCAAGAPLPPGDAGERLVFQELFPGELAALRVRGTSMIDANIQDGDYILIRRDPDPKSGAKVVLSIDGELTLKVLRRTKGEVWLYPCNREMKAVRLSEVADAFVVGVLAGVVRKEK